MKTKTELKKMDPEELEAYAKEAFGVDLDRRKNKATLIDEVVTLQAGDHPAESGQSTPEAEVETGSANPEPTPDDTPPEDEEEDQGDEQEAEVAESETDGMVNVTVTRFGGSEVPLVVNGKRFNLPVGRRVQLPSWALPALADSGVDFNVENDA